MRANMDPLTPATSTLAPAVAHIAGTAEALAMKMQESGGRATVERGGRSVPRIVTGEEEGGEGEGRSWKKRKGERETVRWVLDAPRRLGGLVENGDRELAIKDWEEVKRLLAGWKGIKGTEEVRQECMKALGLVEGEGKEA